MPDWKKLLRADPTDWLLEEDNPSMRYFALRDLLGAPEDDPAVVAARGQIMRVGPVPVILARQHPDGYWGVPQDFYVRSKYRGTVWQLIILAQLGADAADPRIRKACEFILRNSQDEQSGGFAYQSGADGAGDHARVIPCLTGSMTFSLIRLGCGDDPRLARAVEWLVTYQRTDDGEGTPKGWPYDKRPKCWGKHTCHTNVAKSLRALAAIPPARRTPEVRQAIARAAEHMLKHRIFKSSHDPSRIANEAWTKLGFPHMWNFDVLEVLSVLTSLGYRDRRLQDAVDLVLSKQDGDGRWPLESTYNGRFITNIERKGKPSKWVTLMALRSLKRFYGEGGES